ncbi:MAG TPA: hypothetical protein VLM37_05605 [Fibrobacteraceae bacterium]|nr:hypothetical protein [Fibrobacteraceae bacterium]
MMLLLDSYLQNAASWLALDPRSARECALLVIQGSAAEVGYYREKGWNARALVFSVGISDSFSQRQDCFIASPWMDCWGIDGMKFDALVCNASANAVLANASLIRKLATLLTPQGHLHFFVQNPDYYGNLLIRNGRELWPQPKEPPQGFQIGLESLQAGLDPRGCSLVEIHEILDDQYHHPDMSRWPSINGWDCSVYLPQDPQQRKLHFIKSWEVVLAPANHSHEPLPLEGKTLQGAHEEVEDLLEKVRLDEAGLVLDKIFHSGQATAETCNLQGVLHFYRNNFREAWESFRLAILKDPSRLDYYQNLVDAARKADCLDEARTILAKAKDSVPGVGEINFNA